jgi:hypothetical protein
MKKVARIPRLSGVQQISAIKLLADQIRKRAQRLFCCGSVPLTGMSGFGLMESGSSLFNFSTLSPRQFSFT